MDDVLVLVGGTIPSADAAELKRLGVAEVFSPGTPTGKVVAFIERHAPRRDGGHEAVPERQHADAQGGAG